jgi:hypothetical protein
VDEIALRGARQTETDENQYLAKVKVPGSDPVFRSIAAGQGRLINNPVRVAAAG